MVKTSLLFPLLLLLLLLLVVVLVVVVVLSLVLLSSVPCRVVAAAHAAKTSPKGANLRVNECNELFMLAKSERFLTEWILHPRTDGRTDRLTDRLADWLTAGLTDRPEGS